MNESYRGSLDNIIIKVLLKWKILFFYEPIARLFRNVPQVAYIQIKDRKVTPHMHFLNY